MCMSALACCFCVAVVSGLLPLLGTRKKRLGSNILKRLALEIEDNSDRSKLPKFAQLNITRAKSLIHLQILGQKFH